MASFKSRKIYWCLLTCAVHMQDPKLMSIVAADVLAPIGSRTLSWTALTESLDMFSFKLLWSSMMPLSMIIAGLRLLISCVVHSRNTWQSRCWQHRWVHEHVSVSCYPADTWRIIISSLRQNDVATSFWRTICAIIVSRARRVWSMPTAQWHRQLLSLHSAINIKHGIKWVSSASSDRHYILINCQRSHTPK